jgi:hypothetical protein
MMMGGMGVLSSSCADNGVSAGMSMDAVLGPVFGAKNSGSMNKGLCIGVLHFLDNDDLYNQSLGTIMLLLLLLLLLMMMLHA